MLRPICTQCNQNPAAISNVTKGKRYYRKICDRCRRAGKPNRDVTPLWYKAGYRKRAVCDFCGFKAKFPREQIAVFHIDGNLRNCNHANLKSVCLNCRVELKYSKLPGIFSGLTPDF